MVCFISYLLQLSKLGPPVGNIQPPSVAAVGTPPQVGMVGIEVPSIPGVVIPQLGAAPAPAPPSYLGGQGELQAEMMRKVLQYMQFVTSN